MTQPHARLSVGLLQKNIESVLPITDSLLFMEVNGYVFVRSENICNRLKLYISRIRR